MTFDRNAPYNDLPLLPPPYDLETKVVLKQAIGANRALANLRGLADQIPNQRMLINSITLQEARLSSEIENIVTTNDELYRADADADGKSGPHTKEVLRYRQALQHGFAALRERPLSTNLFIEIAQLIKQSELSVRTLINNRHDYYLGLQKVTEQQDWEGWVLFMLRAVESTAQQTLVQVKGILALMEEVREKVKQEMPGIYSKDLIEAIFRHPYTKIQFLVDANIAKRQTSSAYLQALAKHGVLREKQIGREKYFINDALLAELTR
nr:Fic/DOC family N-terminal domain-containing protein [uncultured Duganella sp.]